MLKRGSDTSEAVLNNTRLLDKLQGSVDTKYDPEQERKKIFHAGPSDYHNDDEILNLHVRSNHGGGYLDHSNDYKTPNRRSASFSGVSPAPPQ